ncbi:MAG TPA: Dps family protein [Alphaproteobacteria bacterium]|nr:Dps family protein [Alphaproteobacteria bacterium]
MVIDIGLCLENREKIAKSLNEFLASTFVLYYKTHYAHWSVTGLQFLPLHELFSKQYEELFEAIDPLAERVRSLGFSPPACLKEMIDTSCIESDKKSQGALDTIRFLLVDHETLVKKAQDVFDLCESLKDQVTMDKMIERMDYHTKQAWFLRSHLES